MGLKGKVMELIRAVDLAGLESLARADRRSARHFVGRLWDGDAAVQELAARALGAVAEAHPDLAIDILRRLMWGLTDEAATNGVYGIAAIGEMGARCPHLVRPFVGPLASHLWDDGLRTAILRALARISESAPELIAPFRDLIASWQSTSDLQDRRLVEDLLAEDQGVMNEN